MTVAALVPPHRRAQATLLAHTFVSGIGTATTPPIDTTGASLIVVIQSQYEFSPTATVTDSKGNPYTFLTSKSNNTAYASIGFNGYPIGGTGHTFTKTVTGNDFGTLLVLVFKGGGPFSGGQSGAATSAAGTSLASGAVAPYLNNSIIVTGLCATDNSATPYAVDSSFTVTDRSGWVASTYEGGAAAYLIQGTAASVNPTWSWTGSADAAVVTAVFHPAGSGVVPPAQAVAAGFTTLSLNDDFTSLTVLPSSYSATTETPGYNWYWKMAASTSNVAVNATATAATTSNGNTGGGNYPSKDGGILTITGVASNTNNIGIIQSVPPSLANGVTPTNAFEHFYAEAYMQFIANGTSTSGWVGFWTWALNGLLGELYGPGVEHTEIDIAEYFSGGPATITANIHEWSGSDTSIHQDNFYDTFTQDSNWHTYGLLWTGSGTTGQMTFYRDNVPYATISVGSATNYPASESSKQYLVLSAGQGWPVNVDWVRVWQ